VGGWLGGSASVPINAAIRLRAPGAGRFAGAVTGLVGRETPRVLPRRRAVTFQRTRTWKESPDPQKEQKPAAIEDALEHHGDATFASDEFGPLGIRPVQAQLELHAGTGGGCRPPTTAPTQ
jgi:hypothetical protein